ncbi:MAG: hypothetical protein U0736_14215 [Gemmataceae bacterium]
MSAYSRRGARFERQHTCYACGCEYRYPLHGGLLKNLEPAWATDTHPCPTCGLIQPDMVMWSKVAHPLAACLGLFVLLVLLPASYSNTTSFGLLAEIGLVAFAVLALTHLATVFIDPNADRPANRELAQREVTGGKVLVVEPGRADDWRTPPRNVGLLHLLALLPILAAPAAFYYCKQHLSRTAAPVNRELTPAVITPGERVTYKIDNLNLQAVDNAWRGTPVITVTNADALGIAAQLPAEGSDRQWDTKLKVSFGTFSNAKLVPTIHFTVPADEKLSGKVLKLHVELPIKYAYLGGFNPKALGTLTFLDGATTISRTLDVRVVDVAGNRSQQETLLIGLAAGLAAVVGGLVLSLLAVRLRRQAVPSELMRPTATAEAGVRPW